MVENRRRPPSVLDLFTFGIGPLELAHGTADARRLPVGFGGPSCSVPRQARPIVTKYSLGVMLGVSG
jgi:hypothetical protein